ncbi:homocysteine S-methyltransferase family protein [Dongia mobilis]|uniref:homocysteine S-methyltransferase family protein n=1 Tax=Dongia sp. TaxID=1977262 RepID=UPI0026EFDFDD
MMIQFEKAQYRHALPQLKGGIFLADGGLETTLVFEDGLDLPCFAAFPLLDTDSGRTTLRGYFARYLAIAARNGVGFVLDTPTWRANIDWGAKLGYDAAALDSINRDAVAFIADLRAHLANAGQPIVLSAVIGPRGDGYVAGTEMSVTEAEHYHSAQVESFVATAADMISAITMTNVPEATGIVRAAKAAKMPVVISFTVETDGKLPSGTNLGAAIEAVDAATGNYPAYFMINCAHPTHFENVLKGKWVNRIGGIRANASTKSHAELDAATSLDAGNPQELGQQYRALRRLLPRATVLGGCCGTDHRHVEHICHACAA